MTIETTHRFAKRSPPPSRRQTPQKTLSPSKTLEQLKQDQQPLRVAIERNRFQILKLYNAGSKSWPAAEQLSNANEVIGQELISIEAEIEVLERLVG